MPGPELDTDADGAASTIRLDERSLHLRRLVVDGLEAAGSGHVGSSLSAIEILRVLYDDILRVDPDRPEWTDRDRFILSKGHGCLALYAVLADKGFFDTSLLRQFCAYGSPLGGHPELGTVPGVEWSTGALGHGLSVAVGIALSLRGRSPARVYVLCGDGELGEGSVWEAAMAAAHHGLDRLCVLVDRNGVQSCDRTESVLALEPLAEKWRSFGFATTTVDGHDPARLRSVLGGLPMIAGKPTAIICRTVKGKGLPAAEGQAAWHYRHGIDSECAAAMRAELTDRPAGMVVRGDV